MPTTTTNFGWTVPSDTDLVKDGAAAIRTALGGVDTSMVDLKGGTTGQVLSKASNTDMDFTWVAQDDSNAIQNAIVDAKGDLIVGASADTPARLAVGTNGYVLTANSSATNGVEWAAPAGGGKVLQVVMGSYSTITTSSSSTYADTNLSASITPSATSSKILVIVTQNGTGKDNVSSNASCGLRLLRGSTTLITFADSAGYTGQAMANYIGTAGVSYLDSPSTTSATTYKTQIRSTANNATAFVQVGGETSTITLLEIGA